MMTNKTKLALFKKALEALDDEIEKKECALAEMSIQNVVGSMITLSWLGGVMITVNQLILDRMYLIMTLKEM